MAEETKSTPRPPETDGVSGCTFAKVRGRFSRSLVNHKTTRGKRARRWRAVVWPYNHIDDGSMGGGGPITHDDKISRDDFLELRGKYFLNNQGISHPRYGIFRYGLMAHEIWTDRTGIHIGGRTGYSFIVADNKISGDVSQAAHFMHELGHGLGLRRDETDFNGIDNDESNDWWMGWDPNHPYNIYEKYKSCMNYRYIDSTVDYSDGTHGCTDFNDWRFIILPIGS